MADSFYILPASRVQETYEDLQVLAGEYPDAVRVKCVDVIDPDPLSTTDIVTRRTRMSSTPVTSLPMVDSRGLNVCLSSEDALVRVYNRMLEWDADRDGTIDEKYRHTDLQLRLERSLPLPPLSSEGDAEI